MNERLPEERSLLIVDDDAPLGGKLQEQWNAEALKPSRPKGFKKP